MGKIREHFESYKHLPGDRYVDVLDGIRVLCFVVPGDLHIAYGQKLFRAIL